MAAVKRSIGRIVARLLGGASLVFSALTVWGYWAYSNGKGGEAFVMILLALGLPSFLAGAMILWFARGRR
jgi:hypothetical protein